MTPSHWRIAAGAWMIAACLLLNAGAAAAFADPGPNGNDADGPAATNRAATASGSPNPHTGSATTTRTTPSTTHDGTVDQGPLRPRTDEAEQPGPGATVAMGPRRKPTVLDANPTSDPVPDPQPSAGTDSTAIANAATPVPQLTVAPVTAVLETSPPASPSNEPPAPTTGQNTPTSEMAAPATTDASAPPSVVESEADQGAAAGQNGTESPPDVGSVGQDVIPPSATEIEPTVPPTVVIAPPVSTTVVEAQPVAAAARSRSGPNSLSPMQIFRLMTGGSWFSSAGNAAVPSSVRQSDLPSLLSTSSPGFGRTSVPAQTSSTSAAAPATSSADKTLPEDLRAFFHTYGQLVIAASLSAIAAAALPGLAGMAIPAVAGIRIGYRQAKAARNLRASGIVRFAASGPIGIVRSGSLVALRSKSAGATRRNVSDASERVA